MHIKLGFFIEKPRVRTQKIEGFTLKMQCKYALYKRKSLSLIAEKLC